MYEEISWLGYKTTPVARVNKIVTGLLERGCILDGVPGFYCERESGNWAMDIRGSGKAQMQKIPYMLVIGDKEVKDGNVAVRTRTSEQLNMSVDEFLARITAERDSKALWFSSTTQRIPAGTYILGNDRYCGDIIMQKSVGVDIFSHKRVRNIGQVKCYSESGL